MLLCNSALWPMKFVENKDEDFWLRSAQTFSNSITNEVDDAQQMGSLMGIALTIQTKNKIRPPSEPAAAVVARGCARDSSLHAYDALRLLLGIDTSRFEAESRARKDAHQSAPALKLCYCGCSCIRSQSLACGVTITGGAVLGKMCFLNF